MSGKGFDFSISMDFDEIPKHLNGPTAISEAVPEPEEPQHEQAPATPKKPASPNKSKQPAKTAPGNGTNGQSARDMDILVSSIRQRLVNGESDTRIAEDLNLTPVEYRRTKRKMYQAAVDGFTGKSTEEQYVDYCLEQEKCLKELDEMIKHFTSSRQHNAMVGAIRAKSQILGDVHKTGVQMGVIKQETTWDQEVGGVRIGDLSNKELRDIIAKELRTLQHHIDKFGDKHMTEVGPPSPLADPNIKRVKR
jgi:hypothetical protein